MDRIRINAIQGLHSWRLSRAVAELVFVRPNLRGQERPDKTKKAVLRALADRYPLIWPSVSDIARHASCSVSQAQRVLRELEFKDRLIVDISTRKGKVGGRGKGCTTQYFLMDRKILDIHQQQMWWEAMDETRSSQNVILGHGDRVSTEGVPGCRIAGVQISAGNPVIPEPEPAKPGHHDRRTENLLTDHLTVLAQTAQTAALSDVTASEGTKVNTAVQGTASEQDDKKQQTFETWLTEAQDQGNESLFNSYNRHYRIFLDRVGRPFPDRAFASRPVLRAELPTDTAAMAASGN
jgi:hypothetical protein